VPANDRVWLNNDQGLRPSRPYPPKHNPEHAIEPVQHGALVFSVEHRQLLSQSEHFHRDIGATPKEYAQRSYERKRKIVHNRPL
jgi:hypothetical protein